MNLTASPLAVERPAERSRVKGILKALEAWIPASAGMTHRASSFG